MSSSAQRSTFFNVAVSSFGIGAVAVVLLVGCQGWLGGAAHRADKSSLSDGTATPPAWDTAHVRDVLAKPDGWSLRPTTVEPKQTGQASRRWRHPALEELLSEPDRLRPALPLVLADDNAVVRANAAIGLAWLGDASGKAELVAAVGSLPLAMPQRSAAAEALGALPAAECVEPLRELIDRYGDPSGEGRSRYRGALHVDLLTALARHVDAADDVRFVNALESFDAGAREAALRAWANGRSGTLADAVVVLASDEDSRVRAAAIDALARRRHPQAQRVLADGTRDLDLRVRLAAIAGLGRLGGDESVEVLQGLLDQRGEAIRAAAVSALVAAGAHRIVFDAATDKAWQVRAAAVDVLRNCPTPDGVRLARELLDDQSPEVQHRVLTAIASWPTEAAGSVLLAAMGKSGVKTRRMAAEQLAERWPAAAAFSDRASPEERAASLEELAARFQREFGHSDAGERATAVVEAPAPISPDELAQAQAAVAVLADAQAMSADRRRALDSLSALGPATVEALSVLGVDQQRHLPEVLFTDVLPQHDAVFAIIERLGAADVAVRRRAASELAERVVERPLGRLATARLAARVVHETDALVWRSLLAAVLGDPSEPAIRMAYTAIGDPSAEVRRRACENLAAQPGPRHAAVLLPAVADTNQAVAVAAIDALVAGGELNDTRPLRDILAAPNESLRAAAAAALVCFGDPAGFDALGRLAHSRDVAVRQQVAEAMGTLADRRFAPTLIRMLDDHLTVRRAALAALPQVVGHDVLQDNGQPPRNTTERIALWQKWLQKRDNQINIEPTIEESL